MDGCGERNEQDFSEFTSFSIDNSQNSSLNFDDNINQSSWDPEFQTFASNFGDSNHFQATYPTTNVLTASNVLDVFEKVFPLKEYHELNQENLEFRFHDDKLQKQFTDEQHNPVNAKDLLTHLHKFDTIKKVLHSHQEEEWWVTAVNELHLGHFRDKFDYHKSISKERAYTNSKLESPDRGSKLHSTIDKSKVLTNACDIDGADDLNEANEESKWQECLEELMKKSNQELKNIISDLNMQTKIYSELLLTELNYRDKLQRDQEIKNTFIACHLAVEQKVNEQARRKKKNRYGLFKYSDEDMSKGFNLTIPYIEKEGGPSNSDLLLMTKILQSINHDDEQTPKLISDYVMKLGEQHDLQTVIKVRTTNGLKTIH